MELRIKVKTNEMEILEGISYMYGVSLKKAEETLAEGKYTRDEIFKAIAWYRTEGLPVAAKKDWVERQGLADVMKAYENEI